MQGSSSFPAFTISDGVTPAAVLALIFVVKWLVGRSDKQQEVAQAAAAARDRDIGQLIGIATSAIEQLKEAQEQIRASMDRALRVEKEEELVHNEILKRLDCHHELLNDINANQAKISSSQEATAKLLERMLERLPKLSPEET